MSDTEEIERLKLHEAVLLLALNEETGKMIRRISWPDVIIAGAALAELCFHGRIELSDDTRAIVTVIDEQPCDDPVLDALLERIKAEERSRKLRHWVQKLGTKKLRLLTAQELVRRGVLNEQEGRFLFVFPVTHFPEADPQPEQRLLRRIREALESADVEVDEPTATVIALSYHTELLRAHFSRKQLKQWGDRVAQISDSSRVSEVITKVVKTVEYIYTVAVVS